MAFEPALICANISAREEIADLRRQLAQAERNKIDPAELVRLKAENASLRRRLANALDGLRRLP